MMVELMPQPDLLVQDSCPSQPTEHLFMSTQGKTGKKLCHPTVQTSYFLLHQVIALGQQEHSAQAGRSSSYCLEQSIRGKSAFMRELLESSPSPSLFLTADALLIL